MNPELIESSPASSPFFKKSIAMVVQMNVKVGLERFELDLSWRYLPQSEILLLISTFSNK